MVPSGFRQSGSWMWVAAVVLGCAATLSAQSKGAAALKTADGQPDLQGFWTNATVTPLERPADLAGKEFFTKAEAAKYEKDFVERNNTDKRQETGAADLNGAYNQAFWDRGTHVVRTLRTSLIVDPADGKIPPMTEDGKRRAEALAKEQREHGGDGPENRSLPERCLLWPTAGPPLVPSVYNNDYQIIQSPGYVVIVSEMIHDARVVPLDGRPHLPQDTRQWLGDSRGHWDGNTLVVETTNFTDKTHFRGSSDKLKLTERFTRVDAETIRYQFTVDDPATYTRPWTAEIFMNRVEGPLYEYACHEGNYGMVGILQGAREQEKKSGH